MRKICLAILMGCFSLSLFAQPTFPVNGVGDERATTFAFTHATIVKDPQNSLQNATMLVRNGKIIAIGTNVNVPADAIVTDCSGKTIYPSFIDIYSDYGMAAQSQGAGGLGRGFGAAQLTSNQKGAYGWNQAIKADVNASASFVSDETKAKGLRDQGFGAVLTHQRDGIARGTGTFVSLSGKKENLSILKEKASAHYSFSKGSSTQSYPSSMMGSIALLRQTHIDAKWYRNNTEREGINLSLLAWNNTNSCLRFLKQTTNGMRCAQTVSVMNLVYNTSSKRAEMNTSVHRSWLPQVLPSLFHSTTPWPWTWKTPMMPGLYHSQT